MKKIRVFIDGNSGTTGLRINERLEKLKNIELLSISPELRKDLSERARLIRAADIAFLCLPDEASREICDALKGEEVKIIDTSTAHRTDTDFAYGFAELSDSHRSSIAKSNRVAVPGCHASDSLSSCQKGDNFGSEPCVMLFAYRIQRRRKGHDSRLRAEKKQGNVFAQALRSFSAAQAFKRDEVCLLA